MREEEKIIWSLRKRQRKKRGKKKENDNLEDQENLENQTKKLKNQKIQKNELGGRGGPSARIKMLCEAFERKKEIEIENSHKSENVNKKKIVKKLGKTITMISTKNLAESSPKLSKILPKTSPEKGGDQTGKLMPKKHPEDRQNKTNVKKLQDFWGPRGRILLNKKAEKMKIGPPREGGVRRTDVQVFLETKLQGGQTPKRKRSPDDIGRGVASKIKKN